MAETAWTINVSEAEFETQVLQRSHQIPVAIDFWAPWCQPCRMLGPLLEKLADEYQGRFLLAKVNVDENPMLAQQFGVSGIPQVSAVFEGKIVGQFTGVQSESWLRDWLDRLIPSEARKWATKAAELEKSDPEQAAALYDQVLASEPNDSVSKAALAELALDAGDADRAGELLAQIEEGDDGWARAQNVRTKLELKTAAQNAGSLEDLQAQCEKEPSNLDARKELGLALAAAQRFEESLETLVSIVEADRQFGADHIREEMVRLFNLVGPQSDLANKYRSRLASALY